MTGLYLHGITAPGSQVPFPYISAEGGQLGTQRTQAEPGQCLPLFRGLNIPPCSLAVATPFPGVTDRQVSPCCPPNFPGPPAISPALDPGGVSRCSLLVKLPQCHACNMWPSLHSFPVVDNRLIPTLSVICIIFLFSGSWLQCVYNFAFFFQFACLLKNSD